MTDRVPNPEIPTIAYGLTAQDAEPLALPYVIDDNRIVIAAADVLDVMYEQSGIETNNIYIALGNTAAQQTTEIVFAGGVCRLNLHKRSLFVEGNEVDLALANFNTLWLYARNLDKVVDNDYAQEILWPDNLAYSTPARLRLDERIKKLRDIFDAYVPGLGNSESGILRTVRNAGRVLCSEYLDGLPKDTEGSDATSKNPIQPTTNQTLSHVPVEISTYYNTKIAIAGNRILYDRLSRDLMGMGKTGRLSENEGIAMNELTANLGRLVSSKQLAEALWNKELDRSNKMQIETIIKQIREKLGKFDAELMSIEKSPLLNVRGRGYILLN